MIAFVRDSGVGSNVRRGFVSNEEGKSEIARNSVLSKILAADKCIEQEFLRLRTEWFYFL